MSNDTVEGKKDLTARTEEFFLAILRVVILVVLTICLVGVGVYVVSALKAMDEKPKTYQRQTADPAQFRKELNAIFKEEGESTDGQTERSSNAADKTIDPALEKEIESQYSLMAKFISPFDKEFTHPESIKKGLIEKGEEISEDKSPIGLLKYAEGRSAMYQISFGDKSLQKTLLQKPEFFQTYLDFAQEDYDKFNSEDIAAKAAFDSEEETRVAAAKAAGLEKLKLAAGLFGTFLLLCLILVLVKIERNLRGRKEAT